MKPSITPRASPLRLHDQPALPRLLAQRRGLDLSHRQVEGTLHLAAELSANRERDF